MSNDFQKTADELQASIMENARKIYSEEVIERWLDPRNLGKIRNPDGFAKIKGPCGEGCGYQRGNPKCKERWAES